MNVDIFMCLYSAIWVGSVLYSLVRKNLFNTVKNKNSNSSSMGQCLNLVDPHFLSPRSLLLCMYKIEEKNRRKSNLISFMVKDG